ncbi:MAG: efflux RND transporter permease subunit [Wenzhouxiangellaceae bacterium]
MKLIDIAVRRPVTVAMGALTLVLFGLISLFDLKVNLLPDLAYPTLTVRTEYTGAAPAEIETLLSKPIEESVGVVKNVRSVKSISRAGQSDVILEFAWGTDMDMAGLDVREKLEVLQLPLEATRPLILRFNPSTDPILRLGLGWQESAASADSNSAVLDEEALKALRRLADEELKKQLEPVAGVAAVKISGGLEDEVHIDIDEEKLAQIGLTVNELAQRLAAENVNVSAGRLEDGAQRYLVRTINQFEDVADIANVIVSAGGNRPIYLEDVAHVHQSYKEREAIIRMNGREAVEIAIYKEGDANTVGVARAVQAVISELQENLPDGMELITVDDQSMFINQSIREVVNAALLGGALAMLIIFLFLRQWQATLVIGVAIPISIIATFFLMGQFDISLNIMSLGGIALATGLLVDNAIVVLENIARHRASGADAYTAAKRGASEVGGAVFASTLTTIAVFLPLAFVDGVAGQLFSDQALTVTFALAVSLMVAITLIPMASARLSGRASARLDGGDDASGGRLMQWLRERYSGLLNAALQQRLLVLLISACLLGAALWSLQQKELELIPQLAQGQFEVSLELAPGTPLINTDQAVRQVQRSADELPLVDYAYGVSGSGNRIDANPTEAGENIGRILVALNQHDAASERQVIAELRSISHRLPGVEANFSRPELLSFDKPLEIEVVGYDLPELKRVASAVVQRLRRSNRFVDIESSMERGHPEIQVFFDQERAAALGLTVKDISDQLVNTVRGAVATRYSWRDRKIDVLVRAAEGDRSSIADIRDLIINPRSERPVPLSSVARVVVTEGPAEIRRSDQERVAVIATNIAYGALSAAVADAEQQLAGLTVPPGMAVRVMGQNEELQASTRSLLFALGLAIFLVYLVMASQFESLLHPLVILFSVPLAAVGVALALEVSGLAISVMVMIGLIMLAGIVVNNAIVLIDLINQMRNEGMARQQAIIAAARLRLRPILMTTLTTALGLAPMALGLGEGAEIRAPMAITVISGLLISTLLTLLVIPVVYSLLDRRTDVEVNAADNISPAKA